MPGLNIQVSANVQNAVQGLNTVQQKLAQTAVASGKLGGSVAGINQASNALMNLGRIAQDAPFGFIGIQNNINPLLESFQRLKAETGSTSAALGFGIFFLRWRRFRVGYIRSHRIIDQYLHSRAYLRHRKD
jgi:hypothetical protein